MTCDEFRRLVKNFWRTTRAERMALFRHLTNCTPCLRFTQERAAQAHARDPESCRKSRMAGVALALWDKLAQDPEV